MDSGFEPAKEKKSIRETYNAKRLFEDDTNLISSRAYNLIIGLTIAAGFAINFVMAYFFTKQILSIPLVAVIIAYFIMSLGGMFVVHKSTSAFVSGVGFVVMAVGMGLILTFIFNAYELSSVYMAFGITATVAIVMTVLATFFEQFFLSLGRGLFIGLIAAIVLELLCSFIFPGALELIDYGVILLFAGFIGFDWARAQQFPKTANNAIDAAADLYIDIVNVLIRVLEIIGAAKD
jgi:FtsH-binding integral membrane protein